MKRSFRQSIFAFISVAALCLSFAACSSNDVIKPLDEEIGSYFILNVPLFEDTQSRAENEAESSEVYDVGTSYEYKINKAYLYFFDSSNRPVTLSDGKLYAEVSMNYVSGKEAVSELPTGSTLTNGQGYTSGIQRLDDKLQMNSTYYVYVLCNIPITTSFTTLNDFLEMQQSGDYQTLGMPMASRDSKGNICQSFVITSSNTSSNPVQLRVYVERALARITYTNTTTTFNLYNSTTSTTSIGSVTLTDLILLNTHSKWYTFRHVGAISTAFVPSLASDNSRFGPITNSTAPFVIDPYTKYKNSTGTYVSSIYSNRLGNLSSWHTTWSTSDALTAAKSDDDPFIKAYIPENSMRTEAQIRSQSTAVLMRAKLNPTTVIGTRSSSGDLYYAESTGQFYASLTDVKNAITKWDITTSNYRGWGIRYFKGGYGYYLYYIRHVDNKDSSTMGPMEFVIVRNNSYDLTVKKVAIPYSDEDITDLQTNDDDPVERDEPTYIDATVTVRPWIIREQSSDLR